MQVLGRGAGVGGITIREEGDPLQHPLPSSSWTTPSPTSSSPRGISGPGQGGTLRWLWEGPAGSPDHQRLPSPYRSKDASSLGLPKSMCFACCPGVGVLASRPLLPGGPRPSHHPLPRKVEAQAAQVPGPKPAFSRLSPSPSLFPQPQPGPCWGSGLKLGPGPLGQLLQKMNQTSLILLEHEVIQSLTDPCFQVLPGHKASPWRSRTLAPCPSQKPLGWNFSGCQGRPRPQEEGEGPDLPWVNSRMQA
jgi:hypothetical protein